MFTQMKTKPKVLVTGSNGLLGQKLVQQLVDLDEFEVIATGRGKCRIENTGFQYVEINIEDEKQVDEVIGLISPDILIHGAAMTHVDECELNQEACFKANVVATQNLISASEKADSLFVFVSTDFIFSGLDGKDPYLEDSTPHPVNYYGETKLEAENLVKESALKWAIVRTGLVYGVAQDLTRSNIILWVKSSLEQGKEIQVVDDQVRTPTLAEDLAAGCVLIAQKKATGVFNISGGELLTPFQMAIQTADYFGLDKSLIKRTDSSRFTQPAKRPLKTGFIIDKARKQLGYEPKTFQAGIGILAKQIILASS